MYVLNSTICFIGMPSAGKTTIARKIGSNFRLPVVDLDEYIEQLQKITITKLWQSEGEAAFRCIERFYLLKILSGQPVLLATGGGTPCFFDNLFFINELSFSVYLKTVSLNLTDEMKSGIHPVFSGSQNPQTKWNELLQHRKSYYERADLIQNAFPFEPNVFEAVCTICLDEKIIIRL